MVYLIAGLLSLLATADDTDPHCNPTILSVQGTTEQTIYWASKPKCGLGMLWMRITTNHTGMSEVTCQVQGEMPHGPHHHWIQRHVGQYGQWEFYWPINRGVACRYDYYPSPEARHPPLPPRTWILVGWREM